MRLELKDISEAGLLQETVCQAEDFPILLDLQRQENLQFTEPVVFKLRLQKSGQIVELDGSFVTRIALACGHCLQAFEQPITSDFVLTYTPQPTDPIVEEAEEEVELETDELGLVYYKDKTLELLPSLQDQVLMALPIAPLCREDCRGLCAECGCDLNVENCHCEKKLFNNKFSALAGLKVDTSDS